MLHSIADEFGCDWIYLNLSKKDSSFETSREWNQTKWIVLSSTFFSIPAIFAIHTQSILPYMLIATSLISANYWRNAKRGWRRNLDLIVAKITFGTGLYIAANYLQSNPHRISIIVIICCLPTCYNGSTKRVTIGDPAWVKYHFAFHVMLSIGIALLFNGIRLPTNG